MHPTPTPGNRALAVALVLLMAATPWLAMTHPAAAVVVEEVVGAPLPLDWTFPTPGGSASFDLSLPGGAFVEDALLTLEGAPYRGTLDVNHSVADWRSLPLPVETGFDTSGKALDIAHADAYVGVSGAGLAQWSAASGVEVRDTVRLAPASPEFSASGGGTWRFYKELDISLNLGTTVYDAFTFASVELPKGACRDWKELRILDWLGQEIPYQLAGITEDPTSRSVVGVDLMFPSDMPARGSNTYRLYYGNPSALDPSYPPIIIANEAWPYTGIADPAFRQNWTSLGWTGGPGSGTSTVSFPYIPSIGQCFGQKTTANQGKTFSQVWTSRGKPLADFQLSLMFGNMTLAGPVRSAGYWGIDFRVSGNDCYRLLYTTRNDLLAIPKLQLWRVATTRHLETASTPSDNWRLLDERAVNLSGSDAHFVSVRAQGKSLRVYLNDVERPVLDVLDADLATGVIGTFQGAQGIMLMPNPTTVTGAYGQLVVISTAVNLTSRYPLVVPGGQREQHIVAGEYASQTLELPGVRDAVLDVDIAAPPGTHYSVNLLAPDGSVRLDGLKDGSAVPEGILDGGFRLGLKLSTDLDWTTPTLLGWGVGYRAPAHAGSNTTFVDLLDTRVGGGGIRLAPTRAQWYKHDLAVFKPGNLIEDVAGVEVGCWVPYGDGWRVYYTGRDRFGQRSICMASTDDGLAFRDFRSVLPVHFAGDTWHVESMSPTVLRGDDLWLMYFIGREGASGAVGVAVSGNGVEWVEHIGPALKPTGQPGDYDKDSIEDVFVTYDASTAMLHMYYTGRPDIASERSYILHATSTGGQPWVRKSSSPVLSPSTAGTDWDEGFVADPWVLRQGDGSHVMYYRGGVLGKAPSVGVATASGWADFRKSADNPVLVPQVGGLADDIAGITGVLAVEEGRDRYYMLYSALGSDWVERAFVADSAHMRSGGATGPVVDLLRAPRSMGPLSADAVQPAGTGITYWVRTSDDPRAFPDWVEVRPEPTVPQGIVPARYVQLRVLLTTASADVTPTVKSVHEGWRSDVRKAALTVPTTTDAELVDVTMDVGGTHPAGLVVEGSNDGTSWVGLRDGARVAFAGQGRSFVYRLGISPLPGDAMALSALNFTLGWTSSPSGVYLDVDADGAPDWEHAGTLDGEAQANITDALAALLGTPPGTSDWTEGVTMSQFIRVEVGSATPGALSLTGVHIVLDTRPRMASRTPVAYDVGVDEGKQVEFAVTAEEDDGDALTYEWSVNGTGVAGDGGHLAYTPPTGPVWTGPVPVVLLVSDGRLSVRTNWTLHVRETPPPPPQNRAPQFTSWLPVAAGVSMKENQSATFDATAIDPDGGPARLAFRWYLNDTLLPAATGRNYTFSPGYDDAGTYTLRVEAFDGAAGVNHTWSLTVADARPPTPPPPPPPDGEGDEGWPAWMLPSLLLLLIIGVVAALAIAMRRRGAPGGVTQATGPEQPVEADLGPVAVEGAAPTGAPAPQAPTPGAQPVTESLQRGVSAKPAGKRAAAMGAAAAAPLAPLPIADMERDRMFVVEEVYVIYNDGRLVHHACRDEARCGVDTDLFGGMFTAIQQFIQDSMGGANGTAAQAVGRLDYGENTILVERGKHLFLAVIIYGDDRGVLRDAMRDTLNRIEGAHAGVIERWSGDTSQLAGVAAIVAPLLALTADLTRDAIAARTTEEGVKMLSEVEFYQGYVRLKVAVRNDTKSVITNAAVDISFDTNVLRVQRIQPEYETLGTKVMLGTLSPREKKTVAYYLDPLICQESDIDGTTTYKDAKGAFGTVTMKRRRADIVCPIFFTEENANTAMLKRLVHDELKEQDSKLFSIPKILTARDAFSLAKQVVRSHDVRFVREFVEEAPSYRAEAWFYGVTKVKKNKMVIRASVWDDPKNVEFSVASNRMEAITGLLAELGQNLNEALKEKYMGRAKVTPVMDEGEREAVKGMGLLMDKYSESEAQAGETDQA